MNLNDAVIGETYTVKEIRTDDEELELFLFRLGCYSGEPITVAGVRSRRSRARSARYSRAPALPAA